MTARFDNTPGEAESQLVGWRLSPSPTTGKVIEPGSQTRKTRSCGIAIRGQCALGKSSEHQRCASPSPSTRQRVAAIRCVRKDRPPNVYTADAANDEYIAMEKIVPYVFKTLKDPTRFMADASSVISEYLSAHPSQGNLRGEYRFKTKRC
jgi:hypothetical protein